MRAIALVVVSITAVAGVARGDEPALHNALLMRDSGIVVTGAGTALSIAFVAYTAANARDVLPVLCLFCDKDPAKLSTAIGLAIGGAALVAIGMPLWMSGQGRLDKLRRHDLKIGLTPNGATLSGRF